MTDSDLRCPRCGKPLRPATDTTAPAGWCDHCQASGVELFPEAAVATLLPDLTFETPPKADSVPVPPALGIETWFEAKTPPWEKPAQGPTALPTANAIGEPVIELVESPVPVIEELEIMETPPNLPVPTPRPIDPKPPVVANIPVVQPKPKLSLSHLPEAKTLKTQTVFRAPHELPDPIRPKPRIALAMFVVVGSVLAFILGMTVVVFALVYGFSKVNRPKAALVTTTQSETPRVIGSYVS